MAALQADAVSHVVEELDRRDDPALKKRIEHGVLSTSTSLNALIGQGTGAKQRRN